MMQNVIRSGERLLTIRTLTLMHDGERHAWFLLFCLQVRLVHPKPSFDY